MPNSRAATIFATPVSMGRCSNVTHDPMESTETCRPERPSGRWGSIRSLQASRNAIAVCSSAGKNDSIASSAAVMSSAVPNVAMVLKNASF